MTLKVLFTVCLILETMPKSKSRSRGRSRSKRSRGGTSKSIPPTPARTAATKMLSKARSMSTSRSKSAGKSVSWAPVHDTGYMGSFRKAKKQKRSKAQKFDKYGVVWKREYHNNVTDAECVYVMHGLPVQQTCNATFFALYRTLMNEAGYQIKSWNDYPEVKITAYLKITWFIGNGTVLQFVDQPFYFDEAARTHYEICVKLFSTVRGAIVDSAGNLSSSLKFQEIILNQDNGQALARIDINNYFIEIDYWSILKLKNVTVANEGTDNIMLTNNIYAQALVGRKYESSKWQNGFNMLRQDENSGDPFFTASSVNGSQDGGSLQFGIDNPLNPYRKPPPAYLLGTKKTSVVRLNPGEIKSSVIKWKGKMSFNTYVTKVYQEYMMQSPDGVPRPVGKAQAFAFEREVEIGRITRQIDVKYEVGYVLKVVGMTHKPKAQPITDSID